MEVPVEAGSCINLARCLQSYCRDPWNTSAPAGGRLASRLSAEQLRRAFDGFVVAIGLLLVVRNVG